MEKMIIETERLILRQWRESDLKPFAKLNEDPRVREFFPTILSSEESDAMAKSMKDKIEEKGWGWFAASLKNSDEFIGFIGLNLLNKSTFPTHFTPAVEVGWRLAYEHWGKGYATEAAVACLRYGFENLKLSEIVSFTAIQNLRSIAVMEKIRMHREPSDDFDHPLTQKGHKLRRQVLYRLRRDEYFDKIK